MVLIPVLLDQFDYKQLQQKWLLKDQRVFT